jgi:hypothetical protein
MDERMKAWIKPPGVRTLILITNLIYIASLVIKMWLSNPEFFFENVFQTVNLFFYLYVVLSHFFLKNVRLYFLSSFLLILDLPVNFKSWLQNFLVYQLHISNITPGHLALLVLLALLILIVYRYKIVRYLQIFLFFFYIVSLFTITFGTKRIHSTRLKISGPVNAVSKNYYFLLFDEYPNEQVIKKYDLCNKNDYPAAILSKEGFTGDVHSFSNYVSTVRSTINFLTGSFQSGYNLNNAIHAIDTNAFSHGINYSFTAFSVLDDQNRPNSIFARYYFYNFNNLLTKTIIPRISGLWYKRGLGDFDDCDVYNANGLAKLSQLAKSARRHVVYIHFFTPHSYPLSYNQSITQRLQNANQWISKAVSVLNNNDPRGGVVIFSDHGLRGGPIPVKLWNRNILYYRNVEIDTALINKNGLVDLVKSIRY